MLLAIGIILVIFAGLGSIVILMDDRGLNELWGTGLFFIIGFSCIYFGNIEEDRKTEIQEQLVREVTIMVNNEVLYTGLFKGESSLPESYVRHMQNGDKLNVLYNDVKVKEDHEK